MIDARPGKDSYLSSYRRRGDWATGLRQSAIERFSELGFPTTREESWRYTSLAELARIPFKPPAAHPAPDRASAEAPVFGPWAGIQIAFVNGRHSEDLSRMEGLPAGVKLISLASALAAHRDLVEPHLGRYAPHQDQALAALNTAFLEDGVFLGIPGGLTVEAPIHLLFVSTAQPGGEAFVTHPRVLIVAGENSQATIVESYVGTGPDLYFTNAVTEIAVGVNAAIHHCKLQRESLEAYHVATLQVAMDRDSVFSSRSIAAGGRLVRNDVNAVLEGEGADCTLDGLYALSGRQHVDNHTLVDHASPHGTSRQLYKGVLEDASHGVFDGTVVVRKNAQKTDSRQENRNLILSEEALVDTKPTLLIHADDVKCSHAATTGQVDEASLFYLRSRGLDADSARRIMIHGFVSDLVRRVPVAPVREGLDALLFPTGDRDTGGGR